MYNRKEYQKAWRESHRDKLKEYSKIYRDKNKEKAKVYAKEYSKIHAEKARLMAKLWYQNNRLKAIEYGKSNREKISIRLKPYLKAYRIKNKDILKRKYNERLLTDTEFKLAKALRRRIYMAIKNNYSKKAYSSIFLLGADIQFVRVHIEKQFKDGMNWENYGAWHIDHIIPLCQFQLTDPVEQQKAFHYTNLQPLWAIDNLKKSKKLFTQIT